MIFDRSVKQFNRRKRFFNKWYWYKWTSTGKEINQNLSLILFKEINSKWITDLKVKCKNINLLEKM